MLGKRVPLLPASTIGRLLMLLFVVSPVLTVLTNPDPIYFRAGHRAGPAHPRLDRGGRQPGDRDPSLLPRPAVSRDRGGAAGDPVALVVAGLAYSVPMLIEVRLSPQINTWVYGFFQHELRADDALRRLSPDRLPAARALGRVLRADDVRRRRRPLALRAAGTGAPPTWRPPATSGSCSCSARARRCSSTPRCLVPAVRLLSVRQQIRLAAALALFAVLFPLLRGADLVPVDWIVAQAEAVSAGARRFAAVSPRQRGRAARPRLRERPLFGWGSWGRNHIHDPFTGEIVSTTDGRWIIVIGILGWCGYIVEFGLLTLPLLMLARASRRTRRRTHLALQRADRPDARVQHDRHAAERDPHSVHLADRRSAARLRGGPRAPSAGAAVPTPSPARAAAAAPTARTIL